MPCSGTGRSCPGAQALLIFGLGSCCSCCWGAWKGEGHALPGHFPTFCPWDLRTVSDGLLCSSRLAVPLEHERSSGVS